MRISAGGLCPWSVAIGISATAGGEAIGQRLSTPWDLAIRLQWISSSLSLVSHCFAWCSTLTAIWAVLKGAIRSLHVLLIPLCLWLVQLVASRSQQFGCCVIVVWQLAVSAHTHRWEQVVAQGTPRCAGRSRALR